jgi:hypothetical protein
MPPREPSLLVVEPMFRPGRLRVRPPNGEDTRQGTAAAGIGGKPSSKYPQLAVRVPRETIEQCAEIATKKNVPQWQVVREAIARYHRQTFRRQ